MDREITIYRNKFKIFGMFFFLLLITALFVFIAVYDVRKIGMFDDNTATFIMMKIMCIVFSPVMIFTTFHYLKELFQNAPFLVINARGFLEASGKHSVGVISWADIKMITAVRQGNNAYISVHLKNPRKYIEDEKRLARIKKMWRYEGFVEINVPTLYFNKQLKQVLEVIEYYVDKYHIGEDSGL